MTPQPSTPSLEQLQCWLQAAIMYPGGVQGKEIEQFVLPTSKQSSAERLAVYSSAYYLRLVDCLREFFPCLRFAMGDDVFDDFALAYLQQHPSQSYTLHHLADRFANFLSDTKPAGSDQQPRWEDFFVDLARLEHAIEIVFDAEGPEEPSVVRALRERNLSQTSSGASGPHFYLLRPRLSTPSLSLSRQ
ncbi:MAG: DNA-binding domain-containing protein [Planctomycetales bacterium]|nr:DNA-binding domain-containing protein [Planctomycetales bacterium]